MDIILLLKKTIYCVFPKASPKVRKKIKLYSQLLIDQDMNKNYPEEMSFLRKWTPSLNKPFQIPLIPYCWILEYWERSDYYKNLFKFDRISNSYFINHFGSDGIDYGSLYFPSSFSLEIAVRTYIQLLIEQDKRSPHRYLNDCLELMDMDVFVDVGCAEAIMALEFAQKAKKIVLFESKNEWIEALKNTFAPYRDKTIILSSFAGKSIEKNITTLDHELKSFMELSCRIMIKMDVEGSELDVLEGADKLIHYDNSIWLCATYHKWNDYKNITDIFREAGYNLETNKSFIFRYSLPNEKYYFTPGIVRAFK